MADPPKTMRAWQFANGHTSFSGPMESALVLNTSAPVPEPSMLANKQVIVQVIAAGINPIDHKLFESGYIFKTISHISNNASPGLDFTGTVTAVHPSVTTYAPGQRVFGSLKVAKRFGALGENLIANEDEIGPLPDGVDPLQAAGMGVAGTTGLMALSPFVKEGSKVLINGGRGGTGTFAVQIAKNLGAHVTATTSTEGVDLVRSLGADEIIDYKKEDVMTRLEKGGRVFDVVVDNVGMSPEGLWKKSGEFLKPKGTFVQVAATPNVSFMTGIIYRTCWGWFGCPRYLMMRSKPGHDEWARLGSWAAEGKLKTVIGEVYAMEDVPKAFSQVKSRNSTGKLIINVGGEKP